VTHRAIFWLVTCVFLSQLFPRKCRYWRQYFGDNCNGVASPGAAGWQRSITSTLNGTKMSKANTLDYPRATIGLCDTSGVSRSSIE